MCGHIPEVYIKRVAGIILMFFGTLTLCKCCATSTLFASIYNSIFSIYGRLLYLFGVKFAYFGQVCDIALSKEKVSEVIKN